MSVKVRSELVKPLSYCSYFITCKCFELFVLLKSYVRTKNRGPITEYFYNKHTNKIFQELKLIHVMIWPSEPGLTTEFEFCVVQRHLVSVRAFGVLYDHMYSFTLLAITRADIRPQVKRTVNHVIADGHFNFPWGIF